MPALLGVGGGGFLGGFFGFAGFDVGLLDLRLSNPLIELLDAAGGVEELLLARIERVAVRANLDGDFGQRGAGRELSAAGARYFGVSKSLWMDLRFHSPPIISSVARGPGPGGITFSGRRGKRRSIASGRTILR
jgi:hypothetical protein